MAGPKKGSAFTFGIALTSIDDTNVFKTSPTLAAGDITVSLDGGDFANITTLPTQIQTSGVLPVALTAAEMNADLVYVRFHDAAGDEWQDALVVINTETGTISEIAGYTDDIGAAGAGLTALGDARLGNLDAAISDVADAVLDEVVEGSLTMRQMLRLFAAFMLNKASGGGTATLTFQDIADTKARITMTVNTTTGDRSAVTLDGS